MTLTNSWFLIGLRAPVRLTCCQQGQALWKQVDANPSLKVKPIINFSCTPMFFIAFVLCILRLLKLKTEGQTIFRKPYCKVTKLKWKFSLTGLA